MRAFYIARAVLEALVARALCRALGHAPETMPSGYRWCGRCGATLTG